MFSLKGKKIIIYGYNSLFGRHDYLVKHLQDAGFDLYAIIDQRAESLPITAVTCDEFLQKFTGYKEDYMFILNCNNANTHIFIAEMLYSRGFKNIIFLPFDKRFDRTKAHLMREYFNQILFGAITGDEKLPSYDELSPGQKVQIIRDYGEYISFWIPADLLCLTDIPVAKDTDNSYQTSHFNAVLAQDYTSYLELYDFFFNNGPYPAAYIASRLAGRDEKKVLEDRKRLFEELENQLKYDPNFFIDSPVFVVFNRIRRLFILLDGLHRTIFLLKNGYQQIPVICNKGMAVHYFGG